MIETSLFVVFILIIILWFPYIMHATRHGAPYVGLEGEVLEQAIGLARIQPGETFYELGSGDGRVVIAAALRGANVYGIEIDSLRAWYSKVWIRLLRLNNAHIIQKNFFDVDLSNADIVFMYLLPKTNEKLEPKLAQELKPGTRVISIAFQFPDWKPIHIDPKGTIYGPIYVYQR